MSSVRGLPVPSLCSEDCPSTSTTTKSCTSLHRHSCSSIREYQQRSSRRLNSLSLMQYSEDVHRTSNRVNCCKHIKVSSTPQQLRIQHSSLLWCIILGLFTLLIQLPSAVTQVDVSVTSTLPPPTPGPFNPRECTSVFDNIHQVIYVCAEHPELYPILKYAERLAQEECENSFSGELWNCSNFSLLKEPNITSGDDFLQESAYIHALSMSVIAHTVAKACTQGLLPSCSCDDAPTTTSSDDDSSSVTYTGCSVSIEYGLQVAETFLNKRYESLGRVLKLELVEHNMKAAKMLITEAVESTPVKCKCHGISGSCTIQSCYSDLPEFSVIGEKLKEKLRRACRVSSNGRTSHAWVSKCDRDFDEEDFIFRDSHNWCIPDPSVGSTGVVGRECDPNSSGPNSCENICRRCNRGVERREERVVRDCNCSFRFCCEIECTQCEEERVYYMCS